MSGLTFLDDYYPRMQSALNDHACVHEIVEELVLRESRTIS